jgi:NAD(P)H-dependent FMN reductase
MTGMKNVFAIVGSASRNSSNERLVAILAEMASDDFRTTICDDLKTLPHFDPELSVGETPDVIRKFRADIESADAVIICTPEYVFSIPSGLKNAIEWCVSTTVFTDKPLGIITASADGQKGHEELQLIMRTVMASFTEETTLLIRGIKGKIDQNGVITDKPTEERLRVFIEGLKRLVQKAGKR